jgi:hypothetical protein
VYHKRVMGSALASTASQPGGEVHLYTLETVRWDHVVRSSEGKGNGSIRPADRRMEPCCADIQRCFGLLVPAGKGSQAARAEVEAAILPVNHHTLMLNVRPKHTLGRTFGMTYIVPKHWAFPADFALSHNPPLFFR